MWLVLFVSNWVTLVEQSWTLGNQDLENHQSKVGLMCLLINEQLHNSVGDIIVLNKVKSIYMVWVDKTAVQMKTPGKQQQVKWHWW